jgi:predicted dehydrogenase
MKPLLKAVLVGCGGISAAWLKPAKEIAGLQIVGLVDLIEASARQRAAEFDLPQAVVGVNLEAVLDATRPDIVFDCTVPEAHTYTTLTALRRGCHVLGEKPLADSMEHARQMVAAAQQAGKWYAVMQNRRYLEPVRRIWQLLASGALGPLTTVNCDFYLAPHFGGFRDQMQHVLLMDMAIHTFDMARFMGGVDPLNVFCREWNPAGSWYTHGASAMAIFEMVAPGSNERVVYNYRGSWCAEGLGTSWEAEWRFVGARGSLKWDGRQELVAEVAGAGSAGAGSAVTGGQNFWSDLQAVEIPANAEPEKTAGHASCIGEFVDCVRSGSAPSTVCTDNIKSLAMVFGAIESAESGRIAVIG